MNIKRSLFYCFLISGLLLINFNSTGQQKHKVFKAYLILKNQNSVIKNDSLFEKELRSQLSSLLKKKHFTLVSNEEMETAGQLNLYFQVDIADSLKLSYWKSVAPQGISTISVLPKKNTVYLYKDKEDIIKKVITYAKKNL
jgi:hypothetical protein